jgi:hypothetical protein
MRAHLHVSLRGIAGVAASRGMASPACKLDLVAQFASLRFAAAVVKLKAYG